jgi:hypothetical protein
MKFFAFILRLFLIAQGCRPAQDLYGFITVLLIIFIGNTRDLSTQPGVARYPISPGCIHRYNFLATHFAADFYSVRHPNTLDTSDRKQNFLIYVVIPRREFLLMKLPLPLIMNPLLVSTFFHPTFYKLGHWVEKSESRTKNCYEWHINSEKLVAEKDSST